MLLPLIFNVVYTKNICKKIHSGIRQKQKNTALVPLLPFGYYLDRNTGKVEIDSETAEYVCEIFKLYVDGYGLTTIALLINKMGVRSPEYCQRMPVNRVTVQRNEGKSIDVQFKMTVGFTNSTMIILEPMFEDVI